MNDLSQELRDLDNVYLFYIFRVYLTWYRWDILQFPFLTEIGMFVGSLI
jgi:hypothetical protein